MATEQPVHVHRVPRFPPAVEPPFLAPVSSIMGEVLFIDVKHGEGKTILLDSLRAQKVAREAMHR